MELGLKQFSVSACVFCELANKGLIKDPACNGWFKDACTGFGDKVNKNVNLSNDKGEEQLTAYKAANAYMVEAHKEFVTKCKKQGTTEK